MLSRFLFALFLFALSASAFAAPTGSRPPAPLMTKWGKTGHARRTPWPEYPRPQLVRKDWQNLNGLWDYAITAEGRREAREVGRARSSCRSASSRRCPASARRSRRTRTSGTAARSRCPPAGRASACCCTSARWTGRRRSGSTARNVGTHRGGYDPFTFDITDALKDGEHELVVARLGPDRRRQPAARQAGAQARTASGTRRSPASGRRCGWSRCRTAHITRVRVHPGHRQGRGRVSSVDVAGDGRHPVDVDVLDGDEVGTKVHRQRQAGQADPAQGRRTPKLWSPGHARTCTTSTSTRREHDGRAIDDSVDELLRHAQDRRSARTSKGVTRLMLNDKPLFQVGPLDQGWWPDGLYTAADRRGAEVRPRGDQEARLQHAPQARQGRAGPLVLPLRQARPARLAGHAQRRASTRSSSSAGLRSRTPTFSRRGQEAVPHGTEGDDRPPAASSRASSCGCRSTKAGASTTPNDILKWTKEYDPTRLVNGPSGWTDRGVRRHERHAHLPRPRHVPGRCRTASASSASSAASACRSKGHLWQDEQELGLPHLQDDRGAARRPTAR